MRVLGRLRHEASLAVRLIAILLVLSTGGGITLIGGQIWRGVNAGAEALARQAEEEVESLVPAIADQALIGDYTTIGQIVKRFSLHANVDMVRWEDSRGNVLEQVDTPEELKTPDLFRHLTGLAPVIVTRPVVVGGREYGRVSLQLGPAAIQRQLWQDLVLAVVIMASTCAVGLVLTTVIIRHAMLALAQLGDALRLVEAGDLSQRIKPTGPPEVRRLMESFNSMTSALGLANSRLSESIRHTQAAHVELRRFSEILTHHLQEPVRQILSFTRIAEMKGSDLSEALGFVREGATRMRSMLADIELYLALAHLPGPSRPVSAREAVRTAMTNLNAEIRERDAQIMIDELPAVWLDERRLVSVFEELIGNALEYASPQCPPQITITAEDCPEQEGFVLFKVSDNGIGIEARYFERIFGVFKRLHSRDEHPGNGIGLAIVHKIVTSADGQIHVASTLGAGTTFSFCLPRNSTKAGVS